MDRKSGHYVDNLNEDLRSTKLESREQESRATKKGKWEACKTKDFSHEAHGHASSLTVGDKVDHLTMGPDGIIRSPMSSQAFKSPKTTEIEKSTQEKHLGKKKEAGRAKENFEQTMVAWKRKTTGDSDKKEPISQIQGSKKKRDANGELKSTGSNQEGQIKNVDAKFKFGSGLAEAAKQPRRPQ
jgi:hypothetical protein